MLSRQPGTGVGAGYRRRGRRGNCQWDRACGRSRLGIPCDVGDPESVSRVFATISKGPIDMLINSAGIAHIGTISTTNVQDFERIFRVMYKEPIFACRLRSPPWSGNPVV